MFPLLFVPNGYRIISRVYSYDPKKKRSANQKLTLGVVIDGKYITKEEYHSKYTKRGFARVYFPKPEESAVPVSEAAPSSGRAVLQKMLGAVPNLYGSAVRCGIAEDLEKAYGGSVAGEILSLAVQWLQDRDSAARRFPRFAEQFALPFPGAINEERLSKLYSLLGKDRASLSRLFSLRFGRLGPKSCVNYDSTSVPTSASDVYSKKYSLSMKGVIEPIAHLSVLAEQETGMPVMYNMFGGNNPDCVTVLDLIRKTEEICGKRDLLFVFDRGCETMNNLHLCSANGKNCLMAAAGLDREFVRKVRDGHADFWDASSVIPGTAVHAHSEQVAVKHKGLEFRIWVHVFRSDEKSAAEHAAFFRMLDDFENCGETLPPRKGRNCSTTGNFPSFTRRAPI